MLFVIYVWLSSNCSTSLHISFQCCDLQSHLEVNDKKEMKLNWKLVRTGTFPLCIWYFPFIARIPNVSFSVYILQNISCLFIFNVSAFNCAPKTVFTHRNDISQLCYKKQYAKIKTIGNCIESNIQMFVVSGIVFASFWSIQSSMFVPIVIVVVIFIVHFCSLFPICISKKILTQS